MKRDPSRKQPIVIVGYPKSGNTWVTRLVAELVGGPVKGFWASSHKEIAREGQTRDSEFECFKSHHQIHELAHHRDFQHLKIIYVIRDPRDIAISGAHYFNIKRWPMVDPFVAKWPFLYGYYRMIANSRQFRVNQMIRAVIFGNGTIHHWVRIPWADHCDGFLGDGAFCVHYENLLDAPFRECLRILRFLGVDRDEKAIRTAIENQSFESKKKRFLSEDKKYQASFMRVGKKEQWVTALSPKQKAIFKKYMGSKIETLGYRI